MSRSLIIDGYRGMGDTIYRRPVVRAAIERYDEVHCYTAWPQFFWDFAEQYNHFHLHPSGVRLRTQARNERETPGSVWSARTPPKGSDRVKLRYGRPLMNQGMTVSQIYEYRLPLGETPFDFSLPVHDAWCDEAKRWIAKWNPAGKPLAIVKPLTVRAEWRAPARNPKPEYMQALVDRIAGEYCVVSIADLAHTEWIDGPSLQGVDVEHHHEPLDVGVLAEVLRLADIVLAWPSFMLPMGIAVCAPLFLLFGGMVKPDLLFDQRMDLSRVGWVAPEPFCNCYRPQHECAKDIPHYRLIEAFEAWRERPRVGVMA